MGNCSPRGLDSRRDFHLTGGQRFPRGHTCLGESGFSLVGHKNPARIWPWRTRVLKYADISAATLTAWEHRCITTLCSFADGQTDRQGGGHKKPTTDSRAQKPPDNTAELPFQPARREGNILSRRFAEPAVSPTDAGRDPATFVPKGSWKNHRESPPGCLETGRGEERTPRLEAPPRSRSPLRVRDPPAGAHKVAASGEATGVRNAHYCAEHGGKRQKKTTPEPPSAWELRLRRTRTVTSGAR